MSIMSWIVLGLIAGTIASLIVNKRGEGLLFNIVLGIVGAMMGGLALSLARRARGYRGESAQHGGGRPGRDHRTGSFPHHSTLNPAGRVARAKAETSVSIFTVGHSNRSLEDSVALLQAHDVAYVLDVRTIPRSAHNPQFNRETLPAELSRAGIAYEHLPGLGGLRHTTRDSINTGWRNASCRGFADCMQTAEFEAALQQPSSRAQQERLAIMGAEAVPWCCHRSLIADALLVRGIPCQHITSRKRRQPHRMTPFAKVRQGEISDPPTPSAH